MNSPSSLAKSSFSSGRFFLLNGLNLHGVDERLAGQALVGDVLGITHFELALVSGIGAAQVLGELRNCVLAADLDQHFIHVHGLGFIVAVFWFAVHGSLGEVAFGQRPSFHRRIGGVLLAHAVQGLFDFFVFHHDFRVVGAELLVTFDYDLGEDLEAGLEA